MVYFVASTALLYRATLVLVYPFVYQKVDVLDHLHPLLFVAFESFILNQFITFVVLVVGRGASRQAFPRRAWERERACPCD
ncbi:membrane protein [Candidatus Thiomargarita nelsonii]|uniref:Membrane protein n=1 Tax=Candidatus Thiomargarita nelsonii TaxID=1003181 RepID=A0A176S550_9GAMM|nr:membrane protein [Candidatus Thiomargarita nelsonii]